MGTAAAAVVELLRGLMLAVAAAQVLLALVEMRPEQVSALLGLMVELRVQQAPLLPKQILGAGPVAAAAPAAQARRAARPSWVVVAERAAVEKAHPRSIKLEEQAVSLVLRRWMAPPAAQTLVSVHSLEVLLRSVLQRLEVLVVAQMLRLVTQAAQAASPVVAVVVVGHPLTQVQQAQAAQEAVAWSS